jgi:3-phenylpropionate/trans-cinnamate dioxygenase ferredoxin subunit
MTRVLVGTVFEMPDGAQRVVEVGRDEVLVVHHSGRFYAVGNICSHQELEICGGAVEGTRIKCEHHGSWFDLETGAALNLPAVRPIPAYRTVVDNNSVYVEVDD